MRTAIRPHPTTRANPMWCHTTLPLLWIHISSFTTCPAPFHSTPLLATTTRFNPIQSNRGIHPARPSPSPSCLPPAGRLSCTPLSLLTPPFYYIHCSTLQQPLHPSLLHFYTHPPTPRYTPSLARPFPPPAVCPPTL